MREIKSDRLLDSGFAHRSPAFAPLAPVLEQIDLSYFPSRQQLQRLLDKKRAVNANGASIQLVPPASPNGDRRAYELRVSECGEVEQREESVHDFFNALVWVTFPHAKAALNARHATAIASEAASQRGSVRDALTAFDEEGLIVVSTEPALLDLLRNFQWKTLFWAQRTQVLRAMRWFVFGHAHYEKLLNPYVGLTAKALTFEVDECFLNASMAAQLTHVDTQLTLALADDGRLRSPRDLAPVPVLGIPGWWTANAHEAFYEDTCHFRAGRQRPGGKVGTTGSEASL